MSSELLAENFLKNLAEYDIFVAAAAPWLVGDIAGVHTLGVLSGSGHFPLLTALFVPIISEMIIEITLVFILQKFRHKPLIQRARTRINNFQDSKMLDRFDSLTLPKKFLVFLVARPLPSTRILLLGIVATTNITFSEFVRLFTLSSAVWNIPIVFLGYFIGKGVVTVSGSLLTLVIFVPFYIALIIIILYAVRKKLKKQYEEIQ